MKRVLVTGGAGYIGCCVVEELLKRGHKPVVFDSFYWEKESLKPFMDKLTIIEGDCRNSRDVIYALENVDSIIHLAGIVGESACLSNPKAHFSVNVESTRVLLNCCTDPELDLVRDFIFSSSCSVYGNVAGIYSEVTEKTPTQPLSAYAHAKLRAEKMILDKGKEIPHFHPTVLRLSTVFGWSNRPRLDLVTNAFVYNAWKEGKLTIHGDGQQFRSLIHVRDVAKAFVDVLDAPRLLRSGEIFHVGEEKNNKRVSEIAEAVKKILPNTKIEYTQDKATDRRDYFINCQKIKNVIGWKAQWTVEQGVQDVLENLKNSNSDWEADKYRNSSYKYI